jgi:hypothetical protein
MVNCAGVLDLVQIFFQPGKVFARVRQKQIWLPAYAGTVLLAIASMVLVIQTAGIELLTLQTYERDPKLTAKIGGEAGVDRAVGSSNERGPKLLVVSRTAGIVAVGLVLAAVAFQLALIYFGKKPGFFTMLGTVSFAVFPFAAIAFAITWLLLLSVDDKMRFDLSNMPGLNLGKLLDRSSTPAAILAMGSEMDLILAGQMLMMSFGLKKVAGLTLAQGLALCGVMWAVVVLWKAAWMVYM